MKVYTQNNQYPMDRIRELAGYPAVTSDAHGCDACEFDGTLPADFRIDLYDPSASRTGEVDFALLTDGGVRAYDTAYLALFTACYRVGLRMENRKVVILGEGKRANAAACLAKELGAKEVVTVPCGDSRPDLARHHDLQVLIHTAQNPNPDRSPVETLDVFPYLEGVVEWNPLPLRSRLLEQAEEADKVTVGGLYIAVAQTFIRLGFLRGEPASPSDIGRVHKRLQEEIANIVLVGMEGCGAAEVAEVLAKQTGREVVRVAGIRESILRAGAMTGKILLVSEAVAEDRAWSYSLAQNGRVYFFVRPLELLEGNPLAGEALDNRYRALLPAFRAFADETLSYASDPQVPAGELWRDFLSLPYKKKD